TLHCPARSPFGDSRRLDGGSRRSSMRMAASSCPRRIAARSAIDGGIRFDFPLTKKALGLRIGKRPDHVSTVCLWKAATGKPILLSTTRRAKTDEWIGTQPQPPALHLQHIPPLQHPRRKPPGPRPDL